ncbi:MAG: hypothetical protein AB7E85_02010 [Pseudobdellovibrionaceae bacterium]
MTLENTIENTKLRPEGLPDKFWDEGKGEVRLSALIKSYTELEKKLSSGGFDAESDEGKAQLFSLLGRPETADAYEVDCSHGLFGPDPELNKQLHEKGFTSAQVQAVYDAAAEKLVPLIADMAGEFQADREIERLVEKFGGADKWQEVSRQLLTYGQANLPQDVLEGLSCSYEGVMALYRMMKGETPSLKSEAAMTGTEDESALRAMMKDPRYWKEKDPSFIAKVTKGFEKLYK